MSTTVTTVKTTTRTVTFTAGEVEAILKQHAQMSLKLAAVDWDIYMDGFVRSVTLTETIVENV